MPNGRITDFQSQASNWCLMFPAIIIRFEGSFTEARSVWGIELLMNCLPYELDVDLGVTYLPLKGIF